MPNPDSPQYSSSQQTTNNVLAWLETINLTKNNKLSPRQPLEQQLQSLSLSYKNAQQKLLSLEKQLYHESVHTEKQRSVIEILKYVINGALDDQTILSYLVDMQDESSSNVAVEARNQIRSQLEEIKNIVMRRKKDEKKAESIKNGALNDMKKEINKCNQMKRELMEDLDRVLNEKGVLQGLVQELKGQNRMLTQEKQQLERKMQVIQDNERKLRDQNSKMAEQLLITNKKLLQKTQMMEKIANDLTKMLKKSQKVVDHESIPKYLKKLQQKMQKYRTITVEMSQKLKKQSLTTQLLTSLKSFLPEQALKIFQQFQHSGQKCLIKQIESIALLQKKKYRKLEGCQEEVWRLKERLLREGSWGKTRSRRTGATGSHDKENIQPNLCPSEKVSTFEIEQLDINQH